MARKIISEETKKVALIIQEEFKRRGYIVHRFNDYPNRTIILKLEYGLMDTIRISEKPDGKINFPYKYNVQMDLKRVRSVEKDGKVRYYYPYTNFSEMFETVEYYYLDLIEKYGERWYKEKVEELKMKSVYGYGASYFWKKAARV